MYPIYLIQCVAFLDLLAVGIIIPLIPSHVRQMGGNHLHVGLLGSIYAGFQLGSGPLLGSLSDIKGRRTVLIVTLLLCSISYSLKGLSGSIYAILFLRAVLGIFKQTQVLTKALVPDYVKDEKKQAEIYGKLAAISGAGITFGPVIGGHIIEDNPEHGFTMISILVGICFFINSVLVYFLPKTKKEQKVENSKSKNLPNSLLNTMITSVKEPFSELSKVNWPEYWDIFLFKALIGFAMGVYYSNYALYLKTQYELSPKYTGYVISFQGVIGSVTSYFISFVNMFYVLDDDYSLRNFHVFLLLCMSISGMILSYNVFLYVLWLIPLAIGNAVGRLVTLEMILKRSHGDHRGTLIGASNSVRSMSGVVTPMVAGFIGHYIGVSYVIYASLCATILGAGLSYQNRRKHMKVD